MAPKRSRAQPESLETVATSETRTRNSIGEAYVSITVFEARLLRLIGSRVLPETRLEPTIAGAVSICRHLGGLQAQEVTPAALATWNRLRYDPTLNRATLFSWLTATPQPVGIVRCHGQRGTIHLYDTQTWPMACAALRERLLEKRRKSAGADALRVAHEKLKKKLDAGKSVRSEDLPGAEFALRYSAFMSVTLAGLGTRVETSGRSVIAPRSIVAPEMKRWNTPIEHDAILYLARSYFSAFGPATEKDFRYYMGITAQASTAAVRTMQEYGELLTVEIIESKEGEPASREGKSIDHLLDSGFSSKSLISRSALQELDVVKEKYGSSDALPLLLLGRFDVLVLGHENKKWLISPDMKRHVWSANANVRAVVLVHGRIKGTWTHDLSTSKSTCSLNVVVQLFPGVLLNANEATELKNNVAALATSFFGVDSWEMCIETTGNS